MRLGASMLVIATLAIANTPAAAKECMEPYGRLVEVSPSVYEVRLKPECAGRESVASEPAKESSKPRKAKAKSTAAQTRKPDVAREILELAVAKPEDSACVTGIGTVTQVSDAEIVVGFKQQCKHLAAANAPVSTAASFFSDFFFDEVFEEEITPRRSKSRRRRPKCDESGFCTAWAEPPSQSRIPVASATGSSRIVVADASY